MDDTLRRTHERFLALLEPVRTGFGQFCRALTREREAARDLAQEAIRITYEHFAELRDEAKFKSYLFTSASRLAKRSRWRERNRVEFDPAKAGSIHSNGASPEMGAEVDLLYTALAKLPDETKEAIVLFEIVGFSLEEIRELQGGSLSGVKSRLARGREKLAELLGVKNELEISGSVAAPVVAREPWQKRDELPAAIATYRKMH
jgi:RNA polymerase sigma-70 factor (ECF subfamily)